MWCVSEKDPKSCQACWWRGNSRSNNLQHRRMIPSQQQNIWSVCNSANSPAAANVWPLGFGVFPCVICQASNWAAAQIVETLERLWYVVQFCGGYFCQVGKVLRFVGFKMPVMVMIVMLENLNIKPQLIQFSLLLAFLCAPWIIPAARFIFCFIWRI